jgi:hypothetical protein
MGQEPGAPETDCASEHMRQDTGVQAWNETAWAWEDTWHGAWEQG